LLQALTGDKEWYVRWAAANALGNIGSPEAITPLIQALTGDKNESVRRDAAKALGKIGGPESIEPLIAALEDKGEYSIYEVKDSAMAALFQVSRRLSLRIPLSRRRAKPK
jgi:HEAT repeat protein